MENYLDTIESQFSNSPTLGQLLENFNTYIDPAADIDQFYDLMWNVDTAVGYGLDVWGRIVGVQRVLQVSNTDYFGFSQALPGSQPYNQAPFYNGQQLTSNFALTDDAFRILIYAKAMANICDGSIPAINQILLTLFAGRGDCYVTDGLNMTMTYTFTFQLTPVEQAILGQSGILPKPTGVSATVVQL